MGCFITFEGIEGCGKTTQVRLLAELLKTRGIPVQLTREPGGCPIADQIRSILLDGANRSLTPLAELLLYASARSQHVSEVISPALTEGCVVLCDRFTDATLAYQGFARGLNQELIMSLNKLAAGDTVPQLTILIDCPVEVGLERALLRINSTSGAREERFELESLEFHRRVRDGYLQLAAKEPERFVVVDGTAVVEETASVIADSVLRFITCHESRVTGVQCPSQI
jgi:dTMP kinase